MILTCPSCTTRYFVDDASLGGGRSVRCAACSHTWFAQPALVLSQAADTGEDAAPRGALTREQVERMRRGPPAFGQQTGSPSARLKAQQMERERKQRVRAAIGAWGGAGAAVAAAATGAVLLREDIAGVWPQAAGAYAAVGLDVNVYGLEFADLQIERVYDGPTPTLVVSGAIRNIGGDEKPAPPLRFALQDANGAEVYHWVMRIDGRALAPGGSVPFSSTIDNPPLQAANLEATFASAREARDALQAGHAPRPPVQPALTAPAEATDAPLVLGPEGETHSGEEAPASAAPAQIGSLEPAPLRARPLTDLAPRLPEAPLLPQRGAAG
jgi:predicted Zn finger-like uncharacterized protein